jgi:pyridoxal phosphate enzyme (YggS family)
VDASVELVVERLAAVRQRIERAGGDAANVAILAVTKGFGAEAVRMAMAAGLDEVGENYAQELVAKVEAIAADQPRWHFIGRLQRNKVRKLAPSVHLWQSVDRIALGHEIAHHAPGAAVLVQVNVSAEPQKGGCDPNEVAELVRELRDLDLDVRGLMAVGPTGAPEAARPGYRQVRRLADDLGLDVRSMGMTGDLDVAVEEGSNLVRVGTALFGPRPKAAAVAG